MQKKIFITFFILMLFIMIFKNTNVYATNENVQIEKTVTNYEYFSDEIGGEIVLEVSNIVLNSNSSYKYQLKYNELETQWYDIEDLDLENNTLEIILEKSKADILSILKTTDTAYITIQEDTEDLTTNNILENKEIDISLPLSKAFKVGHWKSGYHGIVQVYDVENILYKYVRIENPEIIKKYMELLEVYNSSKPDIYFGYYMDNLIDELKLENNIPEDGWKELTDGNTTNQPEEDGLYFIWIKAPKTESNKEIIGCVFSYRGSNVSVLEQQMIELQNAELTATVSYDPNINTTGNVTVTIKTNKKVNEVDGWTLAEDEMTLTKIYSDNVTETVHLVDIYGIKKDVSIEVSNIIQEQPKQPEVEEEEESDGTTAGTMFPKAGKGIVLMISLIIAIIIMIIFYEKNNTYNDIK